MAYCYYCKILTIFIAIIYLKRSFTLCLKKKNMLAKHAPTTLNGTAIATARILLLADSVSDFEVGSSVGDEVGEAVGDFVSWDM